MENLLFVLRIALFIQGHLMVLLDPWEDAGRALRGCTPPLPVSFYLEGGQDAKRPTMRLTCAGEKIPQCLPLISSDCTPAPAWDDPNSPAFYIFTMPNSLSCTDD